MNEAILGEYKSRLEDASHGERGDIVNEAMATFGVSKDKLYRELKKLGWQSGRKRRKDAGSTTIDEEAIAKGAAMLGIGRRANGKQVLEATTAHSILTANGYNVLSASSFQRVLRERSMSVNSLHQPKASLRLRSLHPNHVHMLDPSLCLLYYAPGAKSVRRQKFADYDEFYKNKPQNIEKIKNLRVWRYVLVDHYSGLIKVRYFEAAGENQQINFEFVLWCWRQIGLPEILFTDKGSANLGQGMQRMTDALRVNLITHIAGNPRAKGAVEAANNIVEKQFESRLMVENLSSVAELNNTVTAWQNAFNANLVPGKDCRHSRHGQDRLSVWQQIIYAENQGKFRKLPDESVCRYLLRNKAEVRPVKQDLTVSIVHPVAGRSLSYCVENLAHVYVGLKVSVSPLLVDDSRSVLIGVIHRGETAWHEVEPIAADKAGFDNQGAVIGQEYKALPDTIQDARRKEALRTAYPGMTDEEIAKAVKKKAVPFNGELDAVSHLKEIALPSVIKPRGEQVEVAATDAPAKPKQPETTINTIDNITLRQRVVAALYRPLEAPEVAYLRAIGDVDAAELPAIIEKVAAGISADVHILRAVK